MKYLNIIMAALLAGCATEVRFDRDGSPVRADIYEQREARRAEAARREAAQLASEPGYASGSLPRDNRTAPHPTRVLANSVVIPGLGWASMQDYRGGSTNDLYIGLLYFGLSAAAVVFGAKSADKGKGDVAALSFAGLLLTRYFDVSTATDAAIERSR